MQPSCSHTTFQEGWREKGSFSTMVVNCGNTLKGVFREGIAGRRNGIKSLEKI